MLPIILTAGIAISATAIAWYYNYKTKEEEEKQEELKKDISELEQEYDKTLKTYKEKELELKREYTYELRDKLISIIQNRRREKEGIKRDLEILKHHMEDLLRRRDISPYVQRAVKRERVFLEEAFNRLDAYYKYLNWFEKEVNFFSERLYFEALIDLEIPKFQLPDDWLYVGKLIILENQEELNVRNEYGQRIKLSGVKINGQYNDDVEYQHFQSKTTDIPILIVKERLSENNYPTLFYGSVLKGEIFLNHILNNLPMEVKPNDERVDRFINTYLYKDAIKCYMKIQDKKYPLKRYSDDEEIFVYIKEHDLLLNNIIVSEKPPEFEVNLQLPIYIVCSDEELIKSIGEKNLYLSEYDPTKNKIVFRDGILSLTCSIKDYYLNLEEVKEEPTTTATLVELPFIFNIVLDSVIEKNKNLLLYEKENIAKLINFIEQELTYINTLSDQEKSYYDLFQNWLFFIDYQISKREISYENLTYSKLEYTQGKSLQIYIDDSEGNLKTLEQKAIQLAQENRDIKVAFELRFSKNEKYSITPIGTLNDIDLESKVIKVRLDNFLPEKVEFSSNNIVYIGIYQNTTDLYRQKKALINFQRGEMVNPELKRMLITPQIIVKTTDPYEEEAFDKTVKWQNPNLTENQKEIIKKALLEKNIFIIQGPPGTGKTTVIKELVYQFLKENPNKKVLIVSQQNVAVDNALVRIYRDNKKDWFDTGLKTIVRIATDEKRVDEDVQPFVVENWFKTYKVKLIDHYKNFLLQDTRLQKYMQIWFSLVDKDSISEVDREVVDVLLASHSIVGATCVGFANKKFGIDRAVFDLVIIDEAARATLPELLIPILRAKKVILIGDHYQLPPAISKVMVDDSEEIDEISRKLAEKSFFQILFEEIPETNKAMLIDQFRMPKEIGNMISKLFYQGKLRNGIEKSTEEFIDPVVIRWIDVKGKNQKDETSRYNIKEVEKIRDLLIYINSKVKQGKTKEVAIITPYSAQKRYLKQMIENLEKENKVNKLNIKCDTVDSFQGQEADIVTYSCVRTDGNISFLIDEKRLNVALSRVRENLFIVGHKEYLYNAKSKDKENLFKHIIDYIESL